MKTTKLLTLVAALLVGLYSSAQIQFWSDNFEDAGAPSSGTRVPSIAEFGCNSPATIYFKRTDLAGIALQAGSYTGFQGSKFWACEDIDRGPGCGSQNTISAAQTISWNSINISGKTGLSIKGLFGCNNSPSTWEHGTGDPLNPADYMIITYRIDGGPWVDAIRIFATTSKLLALETTGDSIGDGTPFTSYLFTELSANIVGTGTTLDLRFKCFANGTGTEEMAFDDLRLFESPTCTAPVITANPPNRSICVLGNTTFTSSATGATDYQWQVNMGAGFVDIVNGGVYSNATTTTLNITGATGGMNGYQYRLRAMNGVASCFTNTSHGTLNISNMTVSTAKNDVLCFGNSTGSAAVSTPTGGIGSVTYSWAPSGGTSTIAANLAAGNYTITITDGISCQITRNFTITQPASALSAATGGGKTDVSCNGGNNGTATVSANGGTPAYTYSWAPSGGTAATATGLAANTYTVTVTDANNCQATRTYTITQPATALGGTISKTDVSCNGGNNGTATVAITGGTTPYSYSWAPSGGTNATATGLAANTYTCTVTDFNGCQITRTTTVTQPAAALGGTITKTDVSCNGGNNGTATVAPTGGTTPYSYSWSPSGGTNATATGLAANTYTCTVTDFNGCQITRTTTVTQPAAALSTATGGGKTDVSCNGGNNGTATVAPTGGTTPYSYSWSPSGGTNATATGLALGTYTVTVTDFNGCQAQRTYTINQPATALSAASGGGSTNVSCNGGSNGTATVAPTGGTPSYTYSWAPSGGTASMASGLAAGTYTVTVTDANACQATRTYTITQPASALGGNITKTDVSCTGGSNGTATVAPTGGTTPYSYSWAPSGGTNATATGLGAGTYTVTVTDFNGCQITRTTTVTQPAAPISAAAGGGKTDVSCNGGSNGTATVAPTGGTTPYSYSWSPSGGTNATATGLAAGTYTVTVTDFNGCQAQRTYTITQPAAPLSAVAGGGSTNVSCNGGSNGTATVAPTGGTTPYSYSWAPSGGTAATASGLAAGTYTVTVTDFNACQTTRTFTITQPATALSTATGGGSTNVSCNGGSNGTATVLPTGGTTPYSYSWSPSGGTNATASGLAAGTYTVTVTDANTCQATRTFTVNQPTALSAATGGGSTNVSCNGGANGTATVAPTGGTTPYSYSWSPSGGTNATANGLAAGTYTVTVTDFNTCQTTRTFTVTEPTALDASSGTQTNVSCNSGTNGTATVAPTGGTPSYTYSWSPSGGTAATASGLSAGTYTVTVTDANNCQETKSFTVTEPSALDASAGTQVDVLCNGAATGSATVTPTGGTGAYTYSWSPSGGTAATATGLSAGTYTVTVTDANNCQATKSFTLTESALITSSFAHTACNSYTWGTQTYTASGTYNQTFEAANGCDSIVTLSLTISTFITNTVPVTNCSSYTWAQNGETYTASGLYVDTIPSVGGCDSIVTLDLTINLPSASSSNEFACGQFTWAQTGLTYTASGVYTDTILNAAGCDSTITLNLTIGGFVSLQPVNTCGSYTWPVNGVTYTTSGMYYDSLVDGNECDSIRILDLTIFAVPTATATDNGDATITASAGTSYQWVNCATNTPVSGATLQTFAPAVNGLYAVVVTNASNCSDTSNCVDIDYLGLAELDASSVEVFPNPTEDRVTISMSFAQANLVVTDAQGKTQYVGQILNGQSFDLSQYADGVYFLSIQTETGKLLKRIVKQ